jgi:hypothetical protein
MDYLTALRTVYQLTALRGPGPVDADLNIEAGMDGNYARLLQVARQLDARPAHRCPGCEEALTPGFTECGGVGRGVCALTVYAFDLVDHGVAHAAANWVEMHGPDDAPPPFKLAHAIVVAHCAALGATFHPTED